MFIIVFLLGSDRPSEHFFISCRFTSFHTLASLLNFCFFVLFHSCCSDARVLGKHSCMSSTFPIAILNGTYLRFSDSATTSAQCAFRAKK